MKTFYIYKYINKINNKIYVGQCINPKFRQKSHKSMALKGSDACPLFYRAIRKYDYENFDFEIIEVFQADQKAADDREKFWIKHLNALDLNLGYNISAGGKGNHNPLNDDLNKYCSGCELVKLRTEFNKNKSRYDGIEYICRSCYNIMIKEQRNNLNLNEKEEVNKERRDKYAENPEKQLEASKKYYSEHKQERAEYKKEYYIKNAEELKKEHKIWREENKEYVVEKAKNDRKVIKEENSKLTKEQIYARTPIKHCNAKDHDVESVNFYLDLERPDGLGHNCKDCHKAKMAIVREKNRQKLND